jgi:hypothetical protein
VEGSYRSWFINDGGLDTLGRGTGRQELLPEEDLRGRVIWRHRRRFEPGYNLRAEFGWISDRNFLEQYYESEWDTKKDATTGLWLERNIGTQSFNAIAQFQLNDFFTQSSWYPRLDHFVLGQPLLNDRLVWSGHSQIGDAKLHPADPPTNADELSIFNPLAWEADVEGLRAGTRQEIGVPLQIGPVKVVPFVLGDATYWGQDLTGEDISRVGSPCQPAVLESRPYGSKCFVERQRASAQSIARCGCQNHCSLGRFGKLSVIRSTGR